MTQGELVYYSFDCLDCLYSAGAFYPEFHIEQGLRHKKESNHKNYKLTLHPQGVCLIV